MQGEKSKAAPTASSRTSTPTTAPTTAADSTWPHEVAVLADELVGPLGDERELPVEEVVHLDVGVGDVEVDVRVAHREPLVAARADGNDVGLMASEDRNWFSGVEAKPRLLAMNK